MRPEVPSPPLAAPAIARIQKFHSDVVEEVRSAITKDPVVVVGMGWNPHVRRARKALDTAGIPYTYLQYGNYVSAWKPRLAIKMWTGWPTFPQVFAKGTLLGGADQIVAAIDDGSLKKLIG